MDLNAERHFSQVPDTFVDHSKFSRPYDWTCTVNAGVLNCFYWDEAIPGDVYNIKTSQLCRMTTPIFPVMDTCFLDVYYFFVPFRLVYSRTKEMFGENTSTYWTPSTTYNCPTIATIYFGTRSPGDLFHQMGVPLTVSASVGSINVMPFRSVRLIWNEFFRDQNTEAPYLLNTGSVDTDSTLNTLYPVNRVHDMFGSCLPLPQKSGSTVSVGIEGTAPVVTQAAAFASANLNAYALKFNTTSMATASAGNLGIGASGNAVDTTGTNTNTNGVLPSNLYADASKIAANMSIDVNALRESVQMQKILEKLARFGSRYTEVLKGVYGVISDDARLQRPEFLGGERWYLNMADNVQTSASVSGQTPIGTISGYSKTAGMGAQFSYSVREHGYVIGVTCIRHNRSYSQGLNRQFFRTGMFSFYSPALAHIGEQPVYQKEIYAASVTPNDPFGYQEAWYEYRYKPSINAGLMDPGASVDSSGDPSSLGAFWTYGDWYKTTPTLSASWMHEGNQAVERTLAVKNEDQFILQIHVDNEHVRPMPVYSVPGFVDHF